MTRSACAGLTVLLLLIVPCSLSASVVEVSGVPNYPQWEGCGPTAGGMIIGYWQSHGASGLIGGNGNNDWSSSNQSAIKSMIASSDHFYDYVGYTSGSTFISYGTGKDRLDVHPLSLPATYHADNSLADFMWSSRGPGTADGWSGEDRQSDVFLGTPVGMVAYARLHGYTNATGHYDYFGNLWNDFMASIDAHQPVELYVTAMPDDIAKGIADHFVTAFGYDDVLHKYECYEGDGTAAEWYDFQALAAGKAFSIQSGAFFVAPEPATLGLLAFGGFAALMARARRRQR